MTVVQWFVDTLRGVIVWQIGVITTDLNSAIMFVAAFDVLFLTFVALSIWGNKDTIIITRIAAVGMLIGAMVIVALVGSKP